MVGFLFGGTTGLSYNDLQERRAAADALAKRIMGQQPKNVPEGIAALMQGAGAGFSKWQTNKGMKAGQDQATSGFQDYLKNKILGSDVGTAPGPNVSANLPMPGAAKEMSATNPGSGPLPGSFLAAVDKTEGAGGYSTLFGHAERGGPFAGVDVSQMSVGDALAFSDPSGPYAQHVKGKIGRVATPMGRHQIVGKTLRNAVGEMGIDPSTPFNAKTQDDIALHLAKRRVASAGTLDGKIDALRNEWAGFKNVPRPQMAQIVADIESGGQGGGQQFASLDPAAGMQPAAAAIEQQAPGSGYVDPMVSTPNAAPISQAQQPPFDPSRFAGPIPAGNQPQQQMPPQQSALQPLPPPTEIAPPPQVATQPLPQPQPQQQAPQQQVAEAQAQPYSGVDPKLLQLLGNPFLDENQRGVLELLVKQQMQQNDPSQKLDIQYRQAQIDALHAKSSKEDGEEWGLNPVWGKDKDGKTVLGQVSKGGKFKPLETGGFQPTPGLDRIDTGTQIITRDSRTGETLSSVPKDNRQEASEKAIGTAEGKTQAEAQAEFESITSKMPGLYGVVDRLQELADDATYTIAGQALDFGRSQLGMPPRDAAVARAEYTATVDNQILPLLRDTFGAQFTDAEGIRLARTLGDADKTPTEKQALLRAFIQQKERDVSALRTRIGQPTAAPKGARTIGGYTIEQVD